MHISLCWNIFAGNEAQKKTAEEALQAELKGYSWVRPLSTFYVVKIASGEERDQLVGRLIAVAKQSPVRINFIVTPALTGPGGYNGWLPRSLWQKINDTAK